MTGGTGFLGRGLCVRLVTAGVAVTVISRDAYESRKVFGPAVSAGTGAGSGAGITLLDWDSPNLWTDAVAGADAVFHLAGASVAGEKWTDAYKKTILDSRVRTTRAIVDAGPKLLISSSAVGYYGDRKDESLRETDSPGDDFLAQVCIAWEEEAEKAAAQGARVVRIRTGNVLGKGGGPLPSLIDPPGVPFSPWKFGLGGPLGSGRQWFPWIHLEDVLGLMLFCAFDRPEARGAINAVAPELVTNAQFSRALGRALHRPSLFAVPGFVLKGMVGEFADALLNSQKVLPEAAQKLGYPFHFPTLEAALSDLLD